MSKYYSGVAIAQAVWDTHYTIACSDDANLSAWDTPVYVTSRMLVLSTIAQVYSLSAVAAQRVYDVLVETGDSVRWCVDSVRENG
jgi:hypothetical protein